MHNMCMSGFQFSQREVGGGGKMIMVKLCPVLGGLLASVNSDCNNNYVTLDSCRLIIITKTQGGGAPASK